MGELKNAKNFIKDVIVGRKNNLDFINSAKLILF